jgi:CRISPR-associated endonuclease/helicase Cas3
LDRHVFAHSTESASDDEWEPLADHLDAVGRRAALFAEPFGWAQAAGVAGQLHDIGKGSAAFQAYIRQPRGEGGRTRGPDHSTAGARVAFETYGKVLGRLLAFTIAGHHAGLADFSDLERRLDPSHPIEPFGDWRRHTGALPAPAALRSQGEFLKSRVTERGFERAFLTRMLFSCLVDADFLETERFYAAAAGQGVNRGGFLDLGTLHGRLAAHMADLSARAEPTAVNALRAEVLSHATARAALAPGFFTLTVPTGGGKTLASLSFALEHALRHGLRRVVYVIPFTSIIEQTAEVFRRALGTERDVLEHHASFDWERGQGALSDDGEGRDGLAKLRRAAENWEAPVVVTTAVQFFESLYAARPSHCRKLHNLSKSVIVLDEAQTLPIGLMRPCLAVLDELQRNYGATVVLCTATQPALRAQDGALIDRQGRNLGLDIPVDRELAPDPAALYTRLRRVRVERLAEPIEDKVIAARFAEQSSMLCIVNSRAHARELFEAIRDMEGAVHLTTLMCPRHRRAILADVRARLSRKEPVRLVSTSLIEAGVDVDFAEVWRSATGLDSIAQAAGRCNREGRLEGLGRTVVFEPADYKPPHELKASWQAARLVLPRYAPEDLLGLSAVRDYFKNLYWQKGDEALDAAKVDGRPGVLPAITEAERELSFPFRSIADAFRMIDTAMDPVVVPWRADADDEDAERLLAKIASQDRPYASDLRRLQQYTVPIPSQVRSAWLALSVLRPVHAGLGDALLRFEDLAHYDAATGVQLDDMLQRSVEENIW